MSAGGPVHPLAEVDVLCLRQRRSPGRGRRPRGPNGPGQACSVGYCCHHESMWVNRNVASLLTEIAALEQAFCLRANTAPDGPHPFFSRGGGGAMRRRTFLGAALACAAAPPLFEAMRGKRWD